MGMFDVTQLCFLWYNYLQGWTTANDMFWLLLTSHLLAFTRPNSCGAKVYAKEKYLSKYLAKEKKMQQALMYCLLCDTIFMREFKGKKQSDTGKCWHVMWTHHRLWSPRFSLPQNPGEKRVKWKREKKRNRIFITSFGWRWVVKQGSSRSSLRCCV